MANKQTEAAEHLCSLHAARNDGPTSSRYIMKSVLE